MIDEIHVRDLALIGDASIQPAAGLTALTGETGAGKSALLSAVRLLAGDRASGEMVRDGAEALVVEGRFFPRAGADCADDVRAQEGTVVARRVSAEGRSRCTVDGAMATVAQLASVAGSTVDLCGQHEHQRLLSTATHLPLLDAWAAGTCPYEAEKNAYGHAWEEFASASTELERVLAARASDAARVEDARFAVARIEEVDPKPGEFEELEAALPRLEHAEALEQAASDAYRAIAGEGGALDALNAAVAGLEGAARYDEELARLARAAAEAVFPLEDVSSDLRRYRDAVDFDPVALTRADARMGELVGLTRAFGPRMEDVFARLEEARALVALVDDSDALETAARRRLAAAEDALQTCAGALSAARAAAAPRFSAEVTGQMARLQMGEAQLVVDVASLPRAQWGPNGADRVEFLYRPGAGMAARPFARIASGGEVSRVMLAIKVVLGEHDDVETLVFDEIDAGVGGSTARAVGAVLADLARTHQVIVVTHLAQIAAMADAQFVVRKSVSPDDGRPLTSIEPVAGEERVLEVARMLSGDTGAVALDHARELLAESRAGRVGR